MTTVPFDRARVGEKYFFPGTMLEGEIVNIFSNSKVRTNVQVLFPHSDVMYSVKTWMAVTFDEKYKYEKLIEERNKKGAKHVVGIENRGLIDPSSNHLDSILGYKKWSRGLNMDFKIEKFNIELSEDDRDMPEIPGVPVPRPKQGVWSEVDWKIY